MFRIFIALPGFGQRGALNEIMRYVHYLPKVLFHCKNSQKEQDNGV